MCGSHGAGDAGGACGGSYCLGETARKATSAVHTLHAPRINAKTNACVTGGVRFLIKTRRTARASTAILIPTTKVQMTNMDLIWPAVDLYV